MTHDEREYLIQATDFLERTPYVAGYAWFKERVGDNPKISILAPEPGKLTPLGETYVNLPPHEADLYYRIPGQTFRGQILAMDQGDILANSHNDIWSRPRGGRDGGLQCSGRRSRELQAEPEMHGLGQDRGFSKTTR
jgi:hypothetical protein